MMQDLLGSKKQKKKNSGKQKDDLSFLEKKEKVN
jgi:hypothetical protein